MKTWTIRYSKNGEVLDLPPMPEGEAKGLLDDFRKHLDPAAELVDLIAEIAERLPVGSRVRHTSHGWTGVVAEDTAANAPRIRVQDPDLRVSYVPTGLYTAVCVRWDHRRAIEWFDAAWVERG